MLRVRLDGFAKSFAGRPAVQVESLDVAPGEYLTLAGPSGSGKTTLLRLLAGLETPDAGRCRFGEDDVTRWPPERRKVGMVFAEGGLLPHLTVGENAALALRLGGVAAAEAASRLAEVAELLGLKSVLGRRPADLSTGERQRAALARALVRRPALLLLDEPLAALDAPLRTRLRLELREIHRRLRMTVIHVTHDQSEAMAVCDRIALMSEGRIVQIGTPRQVYETPADRWVAGFIGAPPMNFLDATVCGGSSGHVLELPATDGLKPERLRLRVALETEPGPEMVVGFRPERAEVRGVRERDEPQDSRRAGHSFAARFVRCEYLGHTTLWHLRRGGTGITVVGSEGDPPPAGALVEVVVAPGRWAIFRSGAHGNRVPIDPANGV